MSKQTPIQELKEYFEQQLRLYRNSEIKYTTEEALVDAIQVCQNATTKEQQAFEDAFEAGQENWLKEVGETGVIMNGKDYYNQTYKS
jgi:hypothetical protein